MGGKGENDVLVQIFLTKICWRVDRNGCIYVPIHTVLMRIGQSNFWECCILDAFSVLPMIYLDW